MFLGEVEENQLSDVKMQHPLGQSIVAQCCAVAILNLARFFKIFSVKIKVAHKLAVEKELDKLHFEWDFTNFEIHDFFLSIFKLIKYFYKYFFIQ